MTTSPQSPSFPSHDSDSFETTQFPPVGAGDAAAPGASAAGAAGGAYGAGYAPQDVGQQGYAQSGYGPQGYAPTYAPAPQQGGNGTKIVLIIVSLLLGLLILGIAGFFGVRAYNASRSADEVVYVTETATDAPGGEANAAQPAHAAQPAQPAQAPSRPAYPALPAGLNPVSVGAISNSPAGSYANVYTAGPTSDSFALAVTRDFVAARGSKTSGTTVVNTYSPVTGYTYTMSCYDNGSYVHCTGGNNAHVYIS